LRVQVQISSAAPDVVLCGFRDTFDSHNSSAGFGRHKSGLRKIEREEWNRMRLAAVVVAITALALIFLVGISSANMGERLPSGPRSDDGA